MGAFLREGILITVLLLSRTALGQDSEQQSEGQIQDRNPRIALGDLAKDLVSRATTNSQVLSLNLTNLIILLVLKGLLFGATWLGGHHGGGGYGGGAPYGGPGYSRSRALNAADEGFVSEAELLLLTSYLMGDSSQDYNCLHRVACEEPKKTKQYLQAAKLLVKAGKMFEGVIGFNPKYESLVAELQESADFGTKYGSCEKRYPCLKT